jgi:DNA-binding SARP family transcriptional activator/streptogramin lyase
LEFRLLGPFDIVVDGRSVPVGGAKQRALLAILAIHANEVLPADRLIDALWPEQTPDSALNTLQGYVSRLRRALDPDRMNGAEETIAFRRPGYVLRARPEQIDTNRFERLVEEAEDRTARGSPAGAAELLREALALWRGRALSDFVYESFAQAEIVRLEELRLKAIEDRIDAELACARHSALVPELEALVAEHPLRERPRGQLMLALYRSGRQGEALSIYRDAREKLRDELGIEPTTALRELERAILQHDSSVEAPPRRGSAAVVAHLPRSLRVIAAAGIAAAAAVAVGFALRPDGRSAPVKVTANSVAVVDARTNEIVDDIRVGDYPGPIAAGNASIWVASIGDNTVTRIDAKKRKPAFPTGAQQPLDLAVTHHALWIANGTNFATKPPKGGGTIERRGLRFGALKTIRVGPPKTLNEWWTVVTTDGRSVWAGNSSSRMAFRLDPADGRIVERVADVGGASMAIGYGSIWVAEYRRNTVARIDPLRGRVAIRIPVSSAPTRIAAGEGAVWVTTQRPHNAVWKIDPKSSETVAVIPVSPTARRVATGAGYVWVTSGTYAGEPNVPQNGGVLSKIDPRTNRIVATIRLGFRPDGVGVANGLVWVALAPRR